MSKENEIDWSKTDVSPPPAKRAISIRLDEDVLDFFKSLDGPYQSHMNSVLRSYMAHYQSLKKR